MIAIDRYCLCFCSRCCSLLLKSTLTKYDALLMLAHVSRKRGLIVCVLARLHDLFTFFVSYEFQCDSCGLEMLTSRRTHDYDDDNRFCGSYQDSTAGSSSFMID